MKKNAFTLIELLVVISIIGILAALLLANFAGIRDRANDARLKNNLKQVVTALRTRFNDDGSYPASGTCESALTSAYITTSDIPSGCTYTLNTTDTFTVCATLSNTKDTDAGNSTTRCNVAAAPGLFCLCTK